MNYLCKCLGCGQTVWVSGPVCADPETGSLDNAEPVFDCQCPFNYEVIDSEFEYDDPRWEEEIVGGEG